MKFNMKQLVYPPRSVAINRIDVLFNN